jgi:RNA polymerase sigma-70 factor (ECF subfamily)
MNATALLTLVVLAATAFGVAGGAESLRELYRTCGGKVMAVALRILGDRAEAEDVVQETFLELWRRSDRYDAARASPTTWAIVVARSRAIDRHRARASAARAVAARETEPPPDPPALEPVEARQERERVRDALSTLPAEQREAVELAFFEGLTHREIAGRTGQPLGTVKSRVRAAMEKLAQRLALREGAP